MRIHDWEVILLTIALVACGKTQPQRPLVRGESNNDSTIVQLLSMNQHLAAQADVQLARIANESFVLMDENYWVRGLYPLRDHEPTLHEGEYVDIEAQFFSLDEELLTTHQASVKMGQVDEIQAIVQVLPLMQHATHVTLLVPWYMAFGSTGNCDVPPYENLRIELSVQ